MRFLICFIFFFTSQLVFPQFGRLGSWGEFDNEDERRFSICETKGDSCMALGKTKEAKVFFEQALTIKKICRVQQKLNELNQLPVKNCPDLKSYFEICDRAKFFSDQDSQKADSLVKVASGLLDEILYGIPKDQIHVNPLTSDSELKLMMDSIEKLMNEEMNKLAGGLILDSEINGLDTTSIIWDTASAVEPYIIPSYEDPEVLGDEKFKNNDFEMARFYFEEALREKPNDKILKKKIAECDKQIKKLQKKKK